MNLPPPPADRSRDHDDAWSSLASLARAQRRRAAATSSDTSPPLGFATRLATVAMQSRQIRRRSLLWERWSIRTALVTSAAAMLVGLATLPAPGPDAARSTAALIPVPDLEIPVP